jgi:hypothetical protein
MKLTGVLDYNPITLATGKDRARIIRRHSHKLAGYCRMYVPYLQGKARKCGNDLDRLLANDPVYWVRRKGEVSDASKLNKLYQHAQGLQSNTEIPEVSMLISKLVYNIDQQLIVTSRKPGWAILRAESQSVGPYLQELRASGTKISSSAWGAHISVIRGELGSAAKHPACKELLQKTQGSTYTVEVDGKVRKNLAGYYWLNVKAPELEALRVNLGLSARPKTPFHLTIGKAC